MNTSILRGRATTAAMAVATAVLLAGCGGVSDLTRERVGRSETSVQQAQQTIGNEEIGQVELQRAKGNLDQARRHLKDGDEKQADRYAQLAQLDAEVAVAKAQSSRDRKAAEEVRASIQTLQQEAERSSGPERSTSDVSPPER
jgi:flagellar motility protein MotE (MotC chaperone)